MSAPQRIAIGALLALLACGDDDGRTRAPALFEDDFERHCDGAPCGWEQIAGGAGTARLVTTFHAGEHALALEGDRVVVRSPMPESASSTSRFAELQGLITARCDSGATLDVRVATVDDSVGALQSFDARVMAPATWENARVFLRLLEGGGDGGFTPSTARVLSVTLIKGGPGVCEIGDLRIDPAGTGAVVPVGC